jgi:hypothetical protein
MITFAIAAGMLLGGVLPVALASAAPVALQPTAGAADRASSLVAKAQWGYCHDWRHTCAQRCGWGDYGYRCRLWRRGCWFDFARVDGQAPRPVAHHKR